METRHKKLKKLPIEEMSREEIIWALRPLTSKDKFKEIHKFSTPSLKSLLTFYREGGKDSEVMNSKEESNEFNEREKGELIDRVEYDEPIVKVDLEMIRQYKRCWPWQHKWKRDPSAGVKICARCRKAKPILIQY